MNLVTSGGRIRVQCALALLAGQCASQWSVPEPLAPIQPKYDSFVFFVRHIHHLGISRCIG